MLKKGGPSSEIVAVPLELIERRMVPAFRLNEAVKRNARRFPEDFMFQLSGVETAALTSQIVMSKSGRGGRRM